MAVTSVVRPIGRNGHGSARGLQGGLVKLSEWQLRRRPYAGSSVRGEAERVDFVSLVVGEGDRVTASGRLVRNGSGDWFEPPMPAALPGGAPRAVRGPWRGAVQIAGASFDDLSARFEHDGAVEGYATLSGIWSADQLLVEHQGPPPSRRRRHESAPWRMPPCPPPAGGWPHLRWGGGDKNLEAVRAHLHAHHEQWQLYMWGYGPATDGGQAQISARLIRMLPEVAAWAAALPSGILDLVPWLARAAIAARSAP